MTYLSGAPSVSKSPLIVRGTLPKPWGGGQCRPVERVLPTRLGQLFGLPTLTTAPTAARYSFPLVLSDRTGGRHPLRSRCGGPGAARPLRRRIQLCYIATTSFTRDASQLLTCSEEWT